MNLDGARVWVTGASSGIGAAVVPVLAARGARVAVSARRADLLESLATEWRRAGADILVAPVDVTDRAGGDRGGRIASKQTWGGIDLAMLNAGRHRPPAGTGFDTSQFVDMMTLNYFGVLYGIEAVLPGMLRAGTRAHRRRGEPVRLPRGSHRGGLRRIEGRPDSRARVHPVRPRAARASASPSSIPGSSGRR